MIFWGYYGQPFYSEDQDPVLKLQNHGMSGNDEAHRPSKAQFTLEPQRIPIQALNPSRSATLEQAGEDSLKAQKDPEPEKVSSEQAGNSVIVLVWRIYLGFLDISGMFWPVDFTMAPMKAPTTTTMTTTAMTMTAMTMTTTTTMKAMMIKEGKKEWMKEGLSWVELNQVEIQNSDQATGAEETAPEAPATEKTEASQVVSLGASRGCDGLVDQILTATSSWQFEQPASWSW